MAAILEVVDEMDDEEFKHQMALTLYLLKKDLEIVQSFAFVLSMTINNMKGVPLPLKNRRGLAEMLGLDFDDIRRATIVIANSKGQ